jgi:predicted  nucleic acid-binding Zn-ribbon protein
LSFISDEVKVGGEIEKLKKDFEQQFSKIESDITDLNDQITMLGILIEKEIDDSVHKADMQSL